MFRSKFTDVPRHVKQVHSGIITEDLMSLVLMRCGVEYVMSSYSKSAKLAGVPCRMSWWIGGFLGVNEVVPPMY